MVMVRWCIMVMLVMVAVHRGHGSNVVHHGDVGDDGGASWSWRQCGASWSFVVVHDASS
jgi:hypothetical protein